MKTSKQVLTNIFVEGRIYQDIDLQYGSALQRASMIRVLLCIDKISKNWLIQQLAGSSFDVINFPTIYKM